MSVKLGDSLTAWKEEGGGTIGEFRSVGEILITGKRSLVEHRVAGNESSVFKDSGCEASQVALVSEPVGGTAGNSLDSLESKYDLGEPTDSSCDIATLTRIYEVLVEQLRIRQLLGGVVEDSQGVVSDLAEGVDSTLRQGRDTLGS